MQAQSTNTAQSNIDSNIMLILKKRGVKTGNMESNTQQGPINDNQQAPTTNKSNHHGQTVKRNNPYLNGSNKKETQSRPSTPTFDFEDLHPCRELPSGVEFRFRETPAIQRDFSTAFDTTINNDSKHPQCNEVPGIPEMGFFLAKRWRNARFVSHLRHVPYEWRSLKEEEPDVIFDVDKCILIVDFPFHVKHTGYVDRRVASIGTNYVLRVLLVHYYTMKEEILPNEMQEINDCFFHLNILAVKAQWTLVVACSPQEVAQYIESYRVMRDCDASSLMGEYPDSHYETFNANKSDDELNDEEELNQRFGDIQLQRYDSDSSEQDIRLDDDDDDDDDDDKQQERAQTNEKSVRGTRRKIFHRSVGNARQANCKHKEASASTRRTATTNKSKAKSKQTLAKRHMNFFQPRTSTRSTPFMGSATHDSTTYQPLTHQQQMAIAQQQFDMRQAQARARKEREKQEDEEEFTFE